jgi:probable rRNA maturation factor
VIRIEVDNRSGVGIDETGVKALSQKVLEAEGIDEGDLGIAFATPSEMRELKARHLGIDEATDVLSFPVDQRDELPDGVPRQLGDVVLCPHMVGDDWRAPLVHGLLHLLGYDHGPAMERRQSELAG